MSISYQDIWQGFLPILFTTNINGLMLMRTCKYWWRSLTVSPLVHSNACLDWACHWSVLLGINCRHPCPRSTSSLRCPVVEACSPREGCQYHNRLVPQCSYGTLDHHVSGTMTSYRFEKSQKRNTLYYALNKTSSKYVSWMIIGTRAYSRVVEDVATGSSLPRNNNASINEVKKNGSYHKKFRRQCFQSFPS